MKKVANKKSPVRLSKLAKVLSAAKAISSRKHPTWFDKLKPEDQKWVKELCEGFKSGDYPTLTTTAVAKAVSQELKISLTSQTLRDWMRKI